MKSQNRYLALCGLFGIFLVSSCSLTKLKNTTDQEAKVREVIELYTQGTYDGDIEKLRRVFHPKAIMSGYMMGQLMLATPDLFIEAMQKSPLKDLDANYHWNVSYIDIDGKVATVILKESGFPIVDETGTQTIVGFTNYLHMLKDESGWRIISKTFNSNL